MTDQVAQEIPEHSLVGASAAPKWMNCPGLVNLGKKFPVEEGENPHADRGTAAHGWGEYMLRENPDSYSAPKRIQEYLVDAGYVKPEHAKYLEEEDMEENVLLYHDAVMEVLNAGPARNLYVEKSFKLDWIHPDLRGTNDACITESFGRLYVFDLKYGQGVIVHPYENAQLMYYALGALKELGADVTEVVLTIVQPRIEHKDGPVRTWVLTAEELVKWGEEVLKPAALATDAPDAPLVAGTWCKKGFCDYQGACVMNKARMMEVTKAKFDDVSNTITLPDVELLTPAELVQLHAFSSTIKSFLEEAGKYTKNKMEGGVDFPGLKLVRAKTNRKYLDEAKMEAELKDEFGEEIYKPRGLKGIGALGKVISPKRVDDYCYKPEGGLAVALEADSRPEVKSKVEAMFDVVK